MNPRIIVYTSPVDGSRIYEIDGFKVHEKMLEKLIEHYKEKENEKNLSSSGYAE